MEDSLRKSDSVLVHPWCLQCFQGFPQHNFESWCVAKTLGQAIWGMYPHFAGDQGFLVFLGSNTSKF